MDGLVKKCKCVRLGERNGRSVLTDHEVELLRRLHEHGYSYRTLAVKFEISVGQAFNIATYRQR